MANPRRRRVPEGGGGTRAGIPRRARDVQPHRKGPDPDGYDWGVDFAGAITLGGVKLLLSNRYGLRIRSPLRFT
jgi:hypothetical protein